MGDRQQELQASVELIWTLACDQAPEGTDLRPDIEYGKDLLFAAPELLAALEALADVSWTHLTGGYQNLIEDAQDAIRKAKGE
jgi:hypothetical protein